ncbi:MAG: AraC family transcriptional regulator [Clostridia bacterium]|nr:AraC family transcriptional regulator [Clostridia bacterium]
MLHFCLDNPVKLVWFGEFVSPEHGWKHLTRTLYEYELMVVTDGELYIADEQREYAVRAGEYLIMSPTRFQHGTRTCKCRFYWMHFQSAALPASLSLPAHGGFSDGARIARIANELFEAESREHRGIHSRYLATRLLLELARQQGEQTERTDDGPISPQRELCAKIKQYAEWHRFSAVRVKEIARELNYHEKYLSAVFRETEGITLKRYLAQKRTEEAKRLLLDTDYTVTEVANYLNFESPHNFSRFFKQETGVTPIGFRERNKQS